MGACSFMKMGYGKDMESAYTSLCEESKEYYGSNPYNGTISTTYGCRKVYGVVDANTNCNDKKEEKACGIAYTMLDNMEKRECKAIDLGKVSNRITHHNGWHKFLFFGWAAE